MLSLDVPALSDHEAYVKIPEDGGLWSVCAYASPLRPNSDTCEPAEPAGLPQVISFSPFEFPKPFPGVAGPLSVLSVSLNDPAFVEVINQSEATVDRSGIRATLAPSSVGRAFPSANEGLNVTLPDESLAPGEQLRLPLEPLEGAPEDFEGVLTLWLEDDAVSDRPSACG